jgi:putative ABC transport system ATP-binding protein
MNIVEAKGIVKSFGDGERVTTVLKGIDLNISAGEFVAITGRSGSGKSTLMYQLSLLDHPTAGTVKLNGVETGKFSREERTNFRLNHLGFIFQDYAVLPELTALENVTVPLLQTGLSRAQAEELAVTALMKVGLQHRLNNLPSQMSGGEQQRVSIARAIAHKPKILFADEPTANLDSETSKIILDIFMELHAEGQTLLMVTHEPEYAELASEVIVLADGLVKERRAGRNHVD